MASPVSVRTSQQLRQRTDRHLSWLPEEFSHIMPAGPASAVSKALSERLAPAHFHKMLNRTMTRKERMDYIFFYLKSWKQKLFEMFNAILYMFSDTQSLSTKRKNVS